MHRLFIALPLPQNVKPTVTSITKSFPKTAAIRYEPFDKLHITLAFIGTVTPKKKDILLSLMPEFTQNFEPITVELTANFIKSASVVAIKLKPNNQLLTFTRKIYEMLKLAGFTLDKNEFSPHITFGRFKRTTNMQDRKKIKHEIKALLPDKLFSFSAYEFALYESTLTSSGSHYTINYYENFSH